MLSSLTGSPKYWYRINDSIGYTNSDLFGKAEILPTQNSDTTIGKNVFLPISDIKMPIIYPPKMVVNIVTDVYKNKVKNPTNASGIMASYAMIVEEMPVISAIINNGRVNNSKNVFFLEDCKIMG